MLVEHGSIPISFPVTSVLEAQLVEWGFGGIVLHEQVIEHPYVKDYDAVGGPTRWRSQFDLTNWGLLGAFVDGTRIGGAVIAYHTSSVDLLERRSDLAALWDLRVAPAWRRSGVGRALFGATESWSRERQCTQLQIETQNVNVPACHFYLRMGCAVRTIDRLAYRDTPGEVRLLWSKDL